MGWVRACNVDLASISAADRRGDVGYRGSSIQAGPLSLGADFRTAPIT